MKQAVQRSSWRLASGGYKSTPGSSDEPDEVKDFCGDHDVSPWPAQVETACSKKRMTVMVGRRGMRYPASRRPVQLDDR